MRFKLPSPRVLVREHFLSGLLVATPIGVVTWMLGAVIGTLWDLSRILPESWQPSHLFSSPWAAFGINLAFTIVGTALLFLLVSFIGWSSKQYLGERALGWFGEVVNRIPVVRSVYSALGQLLKAMTPSGGGSQFSRVVYLEYPRPGVWTLAFVTSAQQTRTFSEPHLHVYVPTTPNPTSGFYLVAKESEVRESGLTVEEAFKLILSLGIAQPDSISSSACGNDGSV